MDVCRLRAPFLSGEGDHKGACHLYAQHEVAA